MARKNEPHIYKVLRRETPNPRQQAFFRAEAANIAYGGARGGGKSWALRYKLLLMCLRYGGIKILLVRRTLPELTENHIRPLREILAAVPRLSEYSEKDKCITFASGSRLQFGYLARESDLLRYQGQEFDVIAIDEATQISEHMFTVLCASLRGANDFPKRMYLTCNPGGIGHGWVKRLFIERRFRESENPDDYAFIPAGVYDNAALTKKNPDYIRQLENLPEELKKAWLYGSWDVFSGQFFPEFDYSLHTCEPFALGDGTMHFCAIDYGLDMLAALFIDVCRDGRAYVVSEIYESSLIISEAAGKILSRASEGTVFIAQRGFLNEASPEQNRRLDGAQGMAEARRKRRRAPAHFPRVRKSHPFASVAHARQGESRGCCRFPSRDNTRARCAEIFCLIYARHGTMRPRV